MLYRVRTLTSHNAEESENSPESPHLGEIKRMRKQCVPGASPFLRAPGTRLIKVKNPRPQLLKEEVYEVPCMDCSRSYIGEMGRTLQKKLVEYKTAVRRGDTNNGIAVHAWDHQHRVDWENSSVMKQEPGYWKRSLRVATRGH